MDLVQSAPLGFLLLISFYVVAGLIVLLGCFCQGGFMGRRPREVFLGLLEMETHYSVFSSLSVICSVLHLSVRFEGPHPDPDHLVRDVSTARRGSA